VVAVQYKGACLGGTFRYNTVLGAYTTACVNSITAAPQELVMHDNLLVNGQFSGLETVACVSMLNGTSGYYYDNQLFTNVSAPLTASWLTDTMFCGAGNTVSNVADSAPMPLYGGGTPEGKLRSISKVAVTDDAAADLFTISAGGVIDVWGIKQTAEVPAAGGSPTVGIILDAEAAGDDIAEAGFVVQTDLASETTMGDFAVCTTPGAGWTIRQGETPTNGSQLFDSPVRCVAGVIEQTKAGVADALISTYTLTYTVVVPGTTVT